MCTDNRQAKRSDSPRDDESRALWSDQDIFAICAPRRTRISGPLLDIENFRLFICNVGRVVLYHLFLFGTFTRLVPLWVASGMVFSDHRDHFDILPLK